MHVFALVLFLLAVSTLSYLGSRRWLADRLSLCRQKAVRLAIITLAALAMLDFVRPWVFPTALGLLAGNLLAMEDGNP